MYESLKQAVLMRDGQAVLTPTEKFICGSLAGGFGQVTVYPLDVVKTRLAVADRSLYSGVRSCLAATIRHEGVRGLYQGLGPALLGIMPVAGVDLTTFNTCKEWYLARQRRLEGAAAPQQLPLHVSIGLGAVAAVSGGVVGYPLTVVRTRLQVQTMTAPEPLAQSPTGTALQPRYANAFDVFAQIWRRDGLRGLYRGQVPSLMKTVPAISIGYGTFEFTRNVLEAP